MKPQIIDPKLLKTISLITNTIANERLTITKRGRSLFLTMPDGTILIKTRSRNRFNVFLINYCRSYERRRLLETNLHPVRTECLIL